MSESNRNALLRALPAVDRLATELRASHAGDGPAPTEAEAIAVARVVLAERRAELSCEQAEPASGERAGAAAHSDLAARGRALLRPSIRRVLNGTGVVIHTNLGRAPLAEPAVAAVVQAAHGYSNLEIDLESGRRGSRADHVGGLLRELTGAEDALVVNNGAGATLLAIAATGPERGVAVSRSQLVEIGGGFRVPDVLAQAGVPLLEVGTTNRTRLSDYRRAIAAGAGAILRVHQSNFRTVGFVEEVAIEELCSLGVPVIDDLGSGALAEDMPQLAGEPSVRRSLAAGTALVCFSGDKLLGGPQAGILLGRSEAVGACRAHPLARALRIGRLPLAALEATLMLYRDPARAIREVPVLAMLAAEPEELFERAERLARSCEGEVVEAIARVGGGALPLLELSGPAVALGRSGEDPAPLAAALRLGDPALVARISDGRVLVDPRTLAEEEIEPAARAIRRALASLDHRRLA